MAIELLLSRVVSVSRHVTPVAPTDVDALERDLGIVLPTGYREFITRFGEGEYCDLFRIYPPDRIRERLQEQRKWWAESFYEDFTGARRWFFEGSEKILDPASLQLSFPLGDSIDGDVLAFYPPREDRVFILPRHSNLIEHVRADLTDLHRWSAGTPRALTFQPSEGQASAEFRGDEFSLDLAGFVGRARTRWGSEGVIVTHERSDAWSWQTVFFVPSVGVRIQAIEDEGVTRTARTSVATVTMLDSGARSLWITVHGDIEGIPEVRSFLDDLGAAGVLRARER